MKKLMVLFLIFIAILFSLLAAYSLQMLKPASAPQQSTSADVENKSMAINPACVPMTCQQSGRVCGSMANGCHGTIDCGSCPAGQACNSTGQCFAISVSGGSNSSGGGGNVSCTPSCAGKQCGSDGCGGSCGTCADGKICDDGVCSSCTRATCLTLGESCGPWSDGCGGILDCGSCDASYACQSGACVYIGNLTITQEVGDSWWISIFKGDWDTLFSYTVDSSNNTLSVDCQNKIKATYASFVGAAYSLSIEGITRPCAEATNPLPTGCVYSSYSLNTSTSFGNFAGLLYFVDVGGEWKTQTDCRWYT